MRKLLMVGFDALDPAALGIYGWPYDHAVMEIEIPATGPSWTTIYSGDPEHVHKVSAKHFKDWTHGPSNHDSEFLWEQLSARGYRSGLFNLPITYPPRPFHGWHIAGFPLPLSVVSGKKWDFLYPPDLKGVARFKPLHAQTTDMTHWDPNVPVDHWIRGFKRYNLNVFEPMLEKIKTNLAYHRELLRTIENDSKYGGTDFLFLQWSCLDRIGHIYSNSDLVLSHIYPIIREHFELLIASFPAEYVAFLSDHGFIINTGSHRNNGVIGGNPAFMEKVEALMRKKNKFPFHNLWVHDLLLDLFPEKTTCHVQEKIGQPVLEKDKMSEEEYSAVEERLRALGYF